MCPLHGLHWQADSLPLSYLGSPWVMWVYACTASSTRNILSINCCVEHTHTQKKKTEHQRIDAFELWCQRRLLRVPWTVRRSDQSILKELSPGCSLEGLMLKLKLQYFGLLVQRADSLEKTLMLGKIEARGEGGDRGWDSWMASSTRWTWVWVGSGSWWWTRRPGVLRFMALQRIGHNWVTELNWTDTKKIQTPPSVSISVQILYESRSVVSHSLWPQGLCSSWNSPGQNTGVGSLSLLQWIFPTHESNRGLPHCRQILYQLNHKGNWNTNSV